MTHFNTTHETGRRLADFIATSVSQEAEVLAFFRQYPRAIFSPEQVHRSVLKRTPLTSVRRAICNLTDDGFLVKTTIKVTGQYGRPNYCWQLHPDHVAEASQPELF